MAVAREADSQMIQMIAFNLINAEDRELPHDEERLFVFAVFSLSCDRLPQNNLASPLSAADSSGPTHYLTTKFFPLPVRGKIPALEAVPEIVEGQKKNVDPVVCPHG